MRGYSQFSFWISITLVNICFSHIFRKLHKNTFELVGTVLNQMFGLHIIMYEIKKWTFESFIFIADLTELVLPKTCQTDFPDPDDTLNFKLIISPDEVTKTDLLSDINLNKDPLDLSCSKGG